MPAAHTGDGGAVGAAAGEVPGGSDREDTDPDSS